MVTDKNGTEVYCGDLVRYNSDSEIYIQSGWEKRLAYSYDIEKIEDENE